MFNTFSEVETFFANRKSLGIKPGLDRIKGLLELLDHPEKKLKAIHVAGTNGKGSTIQFIKNALQANGYQVGVFTSPSIHGLTGYLFLDDFPISKGSFLTICNEIYPAVKRLDDREMSPTEFEIMTAVAFVYFSKHSDIALIEAGMGGRQDTTNCFTPIMSNITNIASAHTGFLGNSLSEIAYHKAGIIKQNAPVILGEIPRVAAPVVEAEVRDKQTKGYRLGQEFFYKKTSGLQNFLWNSEKLQLEGSIQMLGEHRLKNVSVAYMALAKLKEEFGFSISWHKVIEGIKYTQVPGRFEIIKRSPTIILDGAHNPAGIESFLKTVNNYYADKEKHLLFAAFKDKELETMLDRTGDTFSTITLTTFDHPRAADAQVLFDLTKSVNKEIVNDWHDALNHLYLQKNQYYFITGSLNFIGMVRDYLLKH